MSLRQIGAAEAAESLSELPYHVSPGSQANLADALINALLRIDTLERQVQTLSKDLARVALSKRKYVSDGTLNKE